MKKGVGTAAALGMALFFCVQGARAAALASDSGSSYQNPWGPNTPQNQNRTKAGFAPWVFDQWNPSTLNPPTNTPPPPGLFFIDTTRGAWGITMPADLAANTPGFDAAWISFTGDGYLDSGQTFSTTVLFTPPGTRSGTDSPAEGVDFFAQNPGEASNPIYDGFGHQPGHR